MNNVTILELKKQVYKGHELQRLLQMENFDKQSLSYSVNWFLVKNPLNIVITEYSLNWIILCKMTNKLNPWTVPEQKWKLSLWFWGFLQTFFSKQISIVWTIPHKEREAQERENVKFCVIQGKTFPETLGVLKMSMLMMLYHKCKYTCNTNSLRMYVNLWNMIITIRRPVTSRRNQMVVLLR